MNIFCIMGYTASGKDTITNEIAKNNSNIKKVVPVTTRPIRKGEKDKIDYFFYDKDLFIEEMENLIAIRSFKVWNNDVWHYAFDKREFNNNNLVMSTDIDGFKEIKKEFSEDNVVGIFLNVPKELLIKRLEERNTPREEIERRLKHDEKKYSNILNEDDIHVVFNLDLTTTINKINTILKNEVVTMAKKFDMNKLYLFDMELYKKDIKKRIKKAKTIKEKEGYEKEYKNALNGFAKELMERKYTFMIANENVALYSYDSGVYAIYPEWCKEVTVEEYGKELNLRKEVK